MPNVERKEEKDPQSNGVGWFLLPVVIHFLALVWVCPVASLNVGLLQSSIIISPLTIK